MLFTSAVLSAVGRSSRLIASPAVPMTVDSVNAPARSPAVVPMSYPRSFAAVKALTRHVTHRTTVTASCGSASFLRPRKNWGPTLYPIVNRNRSKKTFFTVAGTLMSSCPMSTPASKVPTTVPRLNVPNRSRPMKKPTARVRKIVSSWCSRKAVTRYSMVGSSADNKEKPRGAQQQEDEETEARGQRPQLVQLALRQVAAAHEDDVLAAPLRSDRREVAAREQQRERHQRRRHSRPQPHVDEHPEERQHLRRLADEQVVHQHVQHEERDVDGRPRDTFERGGQPPADVAHEAELVELAAHGEEHREPEIGHERSAFLRDVVEREHAGGQQRPQAAEGHRGEIELQRPRCDPAGDHQQKRHGHHLLVPGQ